MLDDLKKAGDLAGDFVTTSRASIQRSGRKDEEKSWENAFEQMITHMDIPHEGDATKLVRVPFVPPAVVLPYCVGNEQYHRLFRTCGNSSPEHKLGIALYADEVSPGNHFKPVNSENYKSSTGPSLSTGKIWPRSFFGSLGLY